MLTQLVFEHSLRIRLKAEASNEENEGTITVVGTPDSASATEEGTVIGSNSDEGASEPYQVLTAVSREESRDSSSDSSSTSKGRVKGKNKDHPSPLRSDSKPTAKDKKEAQNLIGKINNLVTTDLAYIVDGRDCLLISTLQFFYLSVHRSFSDTRISFIFPTTDSTVRRLLVCSTWMEVSLSSYSELKE